MALVVQKKVFTAPSQIFSDAPAAIGGAVVSGVTMAFRKVTQGSAPRRMAHFIRWKNQ